MTCNSCKVWFPILIIVLLSLVIAYQFVEPPPPPEVRIATGREGGAYYTFALEYQKLLAQEQFHLDIQPTAGSIEVLEQLKAGTVSVGLVQGGTGKNFLTDGLQSLGSLFYEPLWVFYRKALPIEYLMDLRGKHVAIGEDGSGTQSLALQLLQDNQVTSDNTTLLKFSSQVSVEKLVSGEIDAAFFVTSPTASVISELLNHPEIELLSFRRNIAYKRRYSFLTSVTIGEGMINLENNIPQENKTLLATTATLVARDDLHPDLVHLLLMKVIEVHKAGGLLEKQGQFPSELFVEFPMNEEARYYLQNGPSWLQKIFPFWIASMLNRLTIMIIPLIAIMLPLLKSALPLYRWGIRFKIFRWYDILREVDSKIPSITELSLLEEETKRIKMLQKELIEQVSVPLSYMGEFYTLHIHIRLILERLREQQQELTVLE